MSAVDQLFLELRSQGTKALMPFITAGDPDLEFTADVLVEMAARGCHLFEVGIPYSDPIADGPVIQASYTRALDRNMKLADILQMLGSTAPRIAAPLVTMVSYAIVLRLGLKPYVEQAKAAGVAGLIVPDMPVEESAALGEICREADVSLIQLVAPTTSRERAIQIAKSSTGFLYYVSVVGITGERDELPSDLVENVSWLREHTDLPICIGFGISRPEHVRLLAPVADGLIVGSAIVRRIAQCNEKPHADVIREVGEYCTSLLEALATA